MLARRLLLTLLVVAFATAHFRAADTGGSAWQPLPVQAAQASPSIVPGHVLVGVWPEVTPERMKHLAHAHGYSVSERIPPLDTYRLTVPEGEETAAATILAPLPGVRWARPETLNRALLLPNDTFYAASQWNMRQVGMELAWDVTTGIAEVVVAVLDTGVDPEHPDLVPNLVPGYDFVHDDPVPEDDSAHGTHAAGIVAAVGDNGQGVAGVAWGARIMPIKILDSSGLGPESALIKGLIYAVDQGARIINISSGTPESSPAMAEAIAYAHRKGALLVSAAGNTGDKENETIYPAAYPEVIAVGATDRNNGVTPFSQKKPYVRLVAPGVDVPSTAWGGAGIGRYALATGTSAAAPHVSGVAALIWSLNPELTNDEVAQRLIETADDLGPPGRDDAYGYGIVNAPRALAGLAPGPATPAPAISPIPASSPQVLPTLAPLPPPAPLPRVPSDWYFAEGSTKPPFDTWLHLLNPNSEAVEALIRYLLVDGKVQEQRVSVPPRARTSVLVDAVIPDVDFSIHVHADATIFVERAMFFGHDGHATAGVSAPSTTWYLAEGASVPPFDSWILLQNPNDRPVSARLTFYTNDGARTDYLQFLPPRARQTIYVNLLFQADGFSTAINADAPIIAERAIYFDSGQAGQSAIGVNAAARTWYFAEGSTRPGFETRVVVHNPADAPADVRIRYLREDGEPVQWIHRVLPRGRANIQVSHLLSDASFGATVESNVPIVVERVMTFGSEIRGGHISAAVNVPSQEWYLPEGSTKPPFSQYIALLNPNTSATDVELTLMPAGGGESRVFRYIMRPESRLTIDVNRLAPDADHSARVRASKPVVVERSMYFANGSGGTSTRGISR